MGCNRQQASKHARLFFYARRLRFLLATGLRKKRVGSGMDTGAGHSTSS